jgi:PQQ enzyme repeat
MIKAALILALTIAVSAIGLAHAADDESILTYHGTPDRGGNFVMPALTIERARRTHLDLGFHAKLSGHLYAQPLYWRAGARTGVLVAATESNEVQALDAATGRQLWSRSLGPPVSRAALGCGNINPLGVTGTPVIDPAMQAIYVDAAVGGAQSVRHLVFALALKDGASLRGWPVDIEEALKQRGQVFNARDQNQRGALSILDGRLYVPFGGHYGDCGDYHGWVVGIALRDPRDIVTWMTPARGGGIWAPGGVTTDGKSLYVATGNTFGASSWMGGEAIIRLSRDLRRSANPQDFFTPENWQSLDEQDADLGGTNPVLVDIPGNGPRQAFVVALGKDGHAYLLDRDNLGGIGGSLANEVVSPRPIRTAPASYAVAGSAFVAFQGTGSQCRSLNAMSLGSPARRCTGGRSRWGTKFKSSRVVGNGLRNLDSWAVSFFALLATVQGGGNRRVRCLVIHACLRGGVLKNAYRGELSRIGRNLMED